MAQHTPGPLVDGALYVYTGEVGDAISVAMNGRAANGGWTGISVAKMALPKDTLTREQINEFAAMFAASPQTVAERDRLREINAELLGALKGIIFESHGASGGPLVSVAAAYEDGTIGHMGKEPQERARAAITKAEAGK